MLGRQFSSISVFAALALCTVFNSGTAQADDPTLFRTAFRLGLCPQYSRGDTWIELSYRVGNSAAEIPLSIIAEQLDLPHNQGTFHVMLPRTYGAVPMHIAARCRNASGASRPSNVMSVSNCDFLKFSDSDQDGLANNLEDTNCDNFFSPGDRSNPDNVDTDGDGVRDLVENVEGSDPTNPGSSPRPFVFSAAAFDPDGDGNSNPVVWRPAGGMWYLRDFVFQNNHLGIQFGLPGDVPFTYSPQGHLSDVGVVRKIGTQLSWFFHGAGFRTANGQRTNYLPFGLFGDNVIMGPWEQPGVTNPAVARLFNNHWSFYIYQSDGSVRQVIWGGNGDVPKVQDYDGDGIFDIAVFRPSEQKIYVINSRDGSARIYEFGSGTGDHTVRGDVTGDGVDDIINWEPATGMFETLKSDYGFVAERPNQRVDVNLEYLQLGLYYVHLPMSWYKQNGLIHYTVVDHRLGLRYIRPFNDPYAPPYSLQWGLPGDAQG